MNYRAHVDDRVARYRSNPVVVREEIAFVEEAELYLVCYSEIWATLPPEEKAPSLSHALYALTTLWLANPLQGEKWVFEIARAASLPKSELRLQIKERAEFYERLPELHKRDPRRVESALCHLVRQ